jgi:dynein heavy chain
MCSARVRFPEEEGFLAFDYYYNAELNTWGKWADLVPKYEHPEEEDFNFSKMLVHSVQTCRLNKLCEYHIVRRKPVLFIGSSGTGKTVVLLDFLKKNQNENMKSEGMMFNSYTTAPDVQYNIEAKIDKKTKNIYGLPGGQILVYFVDDLNMPAGD